MPKMGCLQVLEYHIGKAVLGTNVHRNYIDICMLNRILHPVNLQASTF